jgi:hypothetical protein
MCTSHGRGGIQFCRFKILRRNRPSSSRGREPVHKYQSRRARELADSARGGVRECLGLAIIILESPVQLRWRDAEREIVFANSTDSTWRESEHTCSRRGFSPRRAERRRVSHRRRSAARDARGEARRKPAERSLEPVLPQRTPQRGTVGSKNFI